jgi:hypothetical protein
MASFGPNVITGLPSGPISGFLSGAHFGHPHVHQTHAAVADDRQLRVIAIMRHLDAGQLRRLDQVCALRSHDLLAINRQFENVRHALILLQDWDSSLCSE